MMQKPIHSVYWEIQYGAEPEVQSLEKGKMADSVVVGGGMAGLMCAEMLADSGQTVIVLEKTVCGGGASGKTSGFITPDSELELSDLTRNKGNEEAKRLWEFVTTGVEAIRSDIEKYKIDCDYQKQDSLFIANDKKGFKTIEAEHKARLELGYKSRLYQKEDLMSALGAVHYEGAVRYPGTFGMNSYSYCQGLKQTLQKKNVAMYEGTNVTKVNEDSVVANGHTVHAKNIILCTDHFLPELGIALLDVFHVQTFLGITKPVTDAVAKRMFPDERVMVWDSDLVYQYFRITGENRILIGASNVLYTYQKKERPVPQNVIRKMNGYMKRKFPWLEIEIEYVWSGLIGISKDFVPIAARHTKNKNLYFVSASAGLPWAAALGRYIAEKILHGRSDFDALLNPDRKFPISDSLQRLMGTPATFALSHGFVKYFR